jgi:hypothetical protein
MQFGAALEWYRKQRELLRLAITVWLHLLGKIPRYIIPTILLVVFVLLWIQFARISP